MEKVSFILEVVIKLSHFQIKLSNIVEGPEIFGDVSEMEIEKKLIELNFPVIIF
jgi:hypothetical protein